jgi:tripartite-type tricarboxylate transporter receptor subunit TctC
MRPLWRNLSRATHHFVSPLPPGGVTDVVARYRTEALKASASNHHRNKGGAAP